MLRRFCDDFDGSVQQLAVSALTLSQAVHGKTFTPTHRSASSFYFMQCDTGKSSRIHVKHVWTQHRGSRGHFERWIAIWCQRLSRLESSRHRRNEPISRPEVIYFWGISVDEIPYEERHPCNIVLQGELVYHCVSPKCDQSENRSAKCASSWVYIVGSKNLSIYITYRPWKPSRPTWATKVGWTFWEWLGRTEEVRPIFVWKIPPHWPCWWPGYTREVWRWNFHSQNPSKYLKPGSPQDWARSLLRPIARHHSHQCVRIGYRYWSTRRSDHARISNHYF